MNRDDLGPLYSHLPECCARVDCPARSPIAPWPGWARWVDPTSKVTYMVCPAHQSWARTHRKGWVKRGSNERTSLTRAVAPQQCSRCSHAAVIALSEDYRLCPTHALEAVRMIRYALAGRDPFVDPKRGDVVTSVDSQGVKERKVLSTRRDWVVYEDRDGKTKTIKLETWRDWCRTRGAAVVKKAGETDG